MSNSESKILKQVRLALQPYGRYTRVNVGTGWTGNKVRRIANPGQVFVEPGDVVIKAARPFSTGVPAGTADIIGVTRVTITPDMVGQVIGVATAIETKSARGKQRDAQKIFQRVFEAQGGIYGLARSPADVEVILKQKKMVY